MTDYIADVFMTLDGFGIAKAMVGGVVDGYTCAQT